MLSQRRIHICHSPQAARRADCEIFRIIFYAAVPKNTLSNLKRNTEGTRYITVSVDISRTEGIILDVAVQVETLRIPEFCVRHCGWPSSPIGNHPPAYGRAVI